MQQVNWTHRDNTDPLHLKTARASYVNSGFSCLLRLPAEQNTANRFVLCPVPPAHALPGCKLRLWRNPGPITQPWKLVPQSFLGCSNRVKPLYCKGLEVKDLHCTLSSPTDFSVLGYSTASLLSQGVQPISPFGLAKLPELSPVLAIRALNTKLFSCNSATETT